MRSLGVRRRGGCGLIEPPVVHFFPPQQAEINAREKSKAEAKATLAMRQAQAAWHKQTSVSACLPGCSFFGRPAADSGAHVLGVPVYFVTDCGGAERHH